MHYLRRGIQGGGLILGRFSQRGTFDDNSDIEDWKGNDNVSEADAINDDDGAGDDGDYGTAVATAVVVLSSQGT